MTKTSACMDLTIILEEAEGIVKFDFGVNISNSDRIRLLAHQTNEKETS